MMKDIRKFILCFAIGFLFAGSLFAQVSVDDYNRADSTEKWKDLVYNGNVAATWIEKTDHFWYPVKTRKGWEYFLVDAQKLQKNEAFDQKKLCEKLRTINKKVYKPYSLFLKEVSFSNNLKEMNFSLDGMKYVYELTHNKLVQKGKVEQAAPQKYWSETDDERKGPPVVSGDNQWEAYIRDYNVFIKNRNTSQEIQLSYDGSEGEYYSANLQWSPNSKYLITNKIRANVPHYIYFVESSPKTQLQPVLQKRDYLKPGDALPIRKPSLFNVEDKKQIPVNTDVFENQFDLGNLSWRKDSRGFTFEFNQRGHQAYQVVGVNPENGSVKVLINETSKTFIDYSGKHYRHDVDDGKEIIWASERDGWNHLYLYDGQNGEVKNQITKGEWVVREVVDVNDSLRYVIFKGSGKNAGEDPYLIHYYRVNFDGSGLTDLTPELANHDATYSADRKFLVDTYSKVDQPRVTVLRSAADGKVLLSLEKEDISDLLAKGWKMPEVFVAKGRDGKTDIWGNIYRPSNFDPSKSYPVIEYIYAGPQGSFAAKSFNPVFWPGSGLAELGFIVVQMDGMGTSCRSKAFHDVCWKNLKDAGFPDRILWIKAAARKYSCMDTSRVGIFGASAGGQNALTALLFHPEFYKAAAASCGCHDNRMDKMWWNELWMGYPIGPQYAECSNVVNAPKLKGHLLLIVGEVDDNVDPSSTMQVADALIKAKKDFDFLVLPGMNHTLGGTYGERKRRDFFVKYLLNQTPPDWNKQ
ncbi:MAG: DPP IV N-terminal domain-containing protein [Bacteroidota bacterium]|nr:DPP IV N-terminal domain-containing protein [Bacteroidota bacterium]